MEELQRSLGRIEGAVESILRNQAEDGQRLTLVEARVTKLDSWQTRLVGITLGITGVVAFLTGLVKITQAMGN